MTIVFEDQYINYIEAMGVGSKDKIPGDTPKSYVSILRMVSKNLQIDISPETVKDEKDILSIATRLEGKMEKSTIDNCKTALRRYTEMLDANNIVSLPEEVHLANKYFEGATTTLRINAYERDLKARKKCIDHYGCSCIVCNFDFKNNFGDIGDGYIHVHHIVPLSEVNERYEVDPIKDLRPVCPNCHAMIHRKKPTIGVDDLRKTIKEKKNI